MASYRSELQLAVSPEEIFDFLSRPENAAKITAPEAGLRTVVAPEVLEHGSRIELELTGFGPPQRFVYEVIEFIRPGRFTEHLVKGPLSAYRHEHIFEETENGTLVIDAVEFSPPGGMLGFLVNEDRIRSGLEKGMRFRNQELIRMFGEA